MKKHCEFWPIGPDQFPIRSALRIQDMKIHNANNIGMNVFILNRRGGSSLQDEYSFIGGLHVIAYIKSQLDAPILLAQL